jgi:hypothetical protein
LLPPAIVFVPSARAEDGRWFVQAYGEFGQLRHGRLDRPGQAILADPKSSGVRLHLLGDLPATLFAGLTPDPSAPMPSSSNEEPGRSALILRRRADAGTTLSSRFVTLFEPVDAREPPSRVARVTSDNGTVVVLRKTRTGEEHLVFNFEPGTARSIRLADNRVVKTDGFVVRVAAESVIVAGGTFAEIGGRRVSQARVAGTVVRTARDNSAVSRGWFETDEPIASPERLAGRTLRIRHRDGTSRAWTVDRAENLPKHGARIYVREEPGFRIDSHSGTAQAYQFPGGSAPGPHAFAVDQIAR